MYMYIFRIYVFLFTYIYIYNILFLQLYILYMLCTDIFLHLQIHIDIPQHFSAFCQGNAASKGSWLRVLICIRMVNQLTSGLTKFPSFGWCYLGKSWVNRPLYSLCRPFKCVWFLNVTH